MKKKWFKQYRKYPTGKKMVHIDFEKLFDSLNLSVEEFAADCKYSVDGTIAMLQRNTIKISLIKKLKKISKYAHIDKFAGAYDDTTN